MTWGSGVLDPRIDWDELEECDLLSGTKSQVYIKARYRGEEMRSTTDARMSIYFRRHGVQLETFKIL